MMFESRKDAGVKLARALGEYVNRLVWYWYDVSDRHGAKLMGKWRQGKAQA
jgi:hypothetical protein